MFRIEKRNVKITDAPGGKIIDKKYDQNSAAAPEGGQPCFSAENLPPELRELVTRQLAEAEAARRDIEKLAQAEQQAAQRLREQLESRLADAHEQAERIKAEAQEQARSESGELISAARAMAEGIVESARERADAEALDIRGQAWKSGFAEGREVAEKQASEQGEALAHDLHTLIDGLNRGREDMVSRFEQDIISLSLAIAKKIVNVAIKKDDIIFEALIKNALNQMKREGKLSIRLSEEDCSRMFSNGSASFLLGGETVTVNVISDPLLKEGDCILESDAEIVDAGVESQIRAVAIAFERMGEER